MYIICIYNFRRHKCDARHLTSGGRVCVLAFYVRVLCVRFLCVRLVCLYVCVFVFVCVCVCAYACAWWSWLRFFSTGRTGVRTIIIFIIIIFIIHSSTSSSSINHHHSSSSSSSSPSSSHTHTARVMSAVGRRSIEEIKVLSTNIYFATMMVRMLMNCEEYDDWL